MTDKLERLERLGTLLDTGKLTESEYRKLKNEIIDSVAERPAGQRRDAVPEPVVDGPDVTSKHQENLADSKRSEASTVRVWTESGLIIVGGIGLMKNAYLYGDAGEPFLFTVAIDPLVWLGVIGLSLLIYRKSRTIQTALSGRIDKEERIARDLEKRMGMID